MSQIAWEADKMLDVYIHDYLMKRKLHNTAKVFQAEGKVATDSVAIHAPGGFLFEWWSVFWDIFIARTNSKHSEAATSYIETQKVKAQEQQSMQHQHQQEKPPQHSQMQQLQQRRDGTLNVNRASAADALIGNDQLMRQSPSNANAVGDDGAMKRRFGVNNVNQIIDPSVLKAAALASQVPGQILINGPIPGNLQQSPRIRNDQSQQLPNVGTPLTEMNNMTMNIIGSGPDVSLPSIHGQNQGGNNLTLKGWPLTGMEKLRPGVIPQGIPLLQSPQSFTHLQQQLWLQSQQNLASPSSTNDVESARLRMLLAGHLNSIGKTPNVGSPNQLSLLKIQQMQNNNQQHQHYSQHQLSSQTPQSSNHQIRQQERIIGGSNVTADGIMSTSFQENDQDSKIQAGRKRKQPLSSSGPANSSGTANTTGPSPNSPSTPSTHPPADAISMPTMAHTGGGGSSKSLLMFGSDGLGQLTTASNQLANIEGFEDEASLEDNVESFMSEDDAEPRVRVNRCDDVSKGFSFSEVRVIPASTSKIECCHFSSDGKLLATGGHDRKALLWCTDSYLVKSSLEEHSQWITDVRFSPSATRLATSSADKTVRVWDADNPGYSLRTFTGHSSTVMSLDFHPIKEDLISSCENSSEIRFWSVKNGSCVGVSKGGATQVRFQPCFGRTLAAAADNYVSLLDVETQVCRKLQGHKSPVHSVCWDSSGEYLASVSNDLVRVWKVGSSNRGEHAYELSSTGNKFNTCVFHPTFPVLMIGCYETLEIWNMSENKTMSIHAHDNLVTALAVSKASGLVASASHDKCVKLWK